MPPQPARVDPAWLQSPRGGQDAEVGSLADWLAQYGARFHRGWWCLPTAERQTSECTAVHALTMDYAPSR